MRAIAMTIIIGFCIALMMIFLSLPAYYAYGRDLDGRYADSPLKSWFNGLKSGNGLCCDFADGIRLTDVQWDTKDGHYRVYLDDHWIDVPDSAVVLVPNRASVAIVWPQLDLGDHGKVYAIRCFMPGAGM
jgi:hypothetical protein